MSIGLVQRGSLGLQRVQHQPSVRKRLERQLIPTTAVVNTSREQTQGNSSWQHTFRPSLRAQTPPSILSLGPGCRAVYRPKSSAAPPLGHREECGLAVTGGGSCWVCRPIEAYLRELALDHRHGQRHDGRHVGHLNAREGLDHPEQVLG